MDSTYNNLNHEYFSKPHSSIWKREKYINDMIMCCVDIESVGPPKNINGIYGGNIILSVGFVARPISNPDEIIASCYQVFPVDWDNASNDTINNFWMKWNKDVFENQKQLSLEREGTIGHIVGHINNFINELTEYYTNVQFCADYVAFDIGIINGLLSKCAGRPGVDHDMKDGEWKMVRQCLDINSMQQAFNPELMPLFNMSSHKIMTRDLNIIVPDYIDKHTHYPHHDASRDCWIACTLYKKSVEIAQKKPTEVKITISQNNIPMAIIGACVAIGLAIQAYHYWD